jgi:bacterial/archaeal transporter family-2 protein
MAALGLAIGAGAALSLQGFVNGRLGGSVGSAELAGVVSLAISLTAVVLITSFSGALVQAFRRVRSGARPRWWHLVVCANGALVIIVMAEGAPKVGIAMLTVAVVCGQIAGGLLVDAVGMSPAGRRPLTAGRVLGIALALTCISGCSPSPLPPACRSRCIRPRSVTSRASPATLSSPPA